jgi:hypothetical protein
MLLIVTDGGLLMHHRDDKPGIANPDCWAGFEGAVEVGETVEEADLQEGAGVGIRRLADLPGLKVTPFVRRAIQSHLLPVLADLL